MKLTGASRPPHSLGRGAAAAPALRPGGARSLSGCSADREGASQSWIGAKMTRQILAVGGALLYASLVAGCGGGHDVPGTPDSATISWRLEVAAQGDVSFGARILLDGEQVYLEPSPTQVAHRVKIKRPYVAGQHVLEVEIVWSTQSPPVYAASCTAQVSQNGRLVHADGIPSTLRVGERLRLSVSL